MQTLIMFAREPLAGRTKTRLCPPLDGAAAAALYGCFLRDLLLTARCVPDTALAVAYTPESDPAYFQHLAPDLPAFPQHGADLGERMANAFAHCTQGADDQPMVLIGSDFPTLPAGHIAAAFGLLSGGADVVFGPSDDGGYYLVGLRQPQPHLLRAVPMSTPSVLADSLALAAQGGLRVALAPPHYDVDTAAELARLRAELQVAPPAVAPHTRAFLARVPG